MTLEEFANATLEVIGDGDLAEFLPTLFVDDEIQVIEGIPEHVDHRVAIQSMIRKNKIDGSEFLFAVASGVNQVTVGHHSPGKRATFIYISRVGRSLQTDSADSCDWWLIPSQSGNA